MGIVGKNDAELGTAGQTGFGKGGRNRTVDQLRQYCLTGPVACFERYIDINGRR